MLLLDCNPEVDSLKHLLETGASVNAPPDPCEQSPVHLAAGGGLAHFLLWQLQTGADLNQQDVLGEAPLHKAARVGSLECLSLLVANDAQIDLCNKNGQTAEDLAWSCGFLECAKFLTTIKSMQTIKSNEQPNKDHCVPVLRQKRRFGNVECTNGKRKCCSLLWPGKAAEDGPSPWAPAPTGEAQKKLLALDRPSSRCCGHFGSEPADGRSRSLSLSLSFPPCFPNK